MIQEENSLPQSMGCSPLKIGRSIDFDVKQDSMFRVKFPLMLLWEWLSPSLDDSRMLELFLCHNYLKILKQKRSRVLKLLCPSDPNND
ncbi:hypothetical protein PanWU01x14_141000 [Parasponia andersonii]|uniref:Uncharacterized protein n=1 Tax=Parasponia andersonii TaxID=3476 RepID=A0A2P5CM28_PARAD|nr:hypothetical protein PanWU01x14_141000 [Parasponia andersonii]